MSSDPIAVMLTTVERPVQPRPEFAAELLAVLERELGVEQEPRARESVRRTWHPFLRPLVGVAAALALVLAVVSVLVLDTGGRTAEAAMVDARTAFSRLPAVHVTYTTRSSEDSVPGLERAVETEVLYADPTHWLNRTTGVSGTTSFRVGDFRVADGSLEGTYTQDPPLLSVRRLSEVSGLVSASGLGVVSPDEVWAEGPRDGVPPTTWFRDECSVEDVTVLDRPAALLSCDGDRLRVWLDDATGLVLRVTDVDLDITVTSLDLGPRFATDTFKIDAPPGALLRWDGAPPVPPAYRTKPSEELRTIQLAGDAGWMVAAAGTGVWVVTQDGDESPFKLLLQHVGPDGALSRRVRLQDQIDELLVTEDRLWLAASTDGHGRGPSWVRPHDPVTGQPLGPRIAFEPRGATSASMTSTPGVLWFAGGARTTRRHDATHSSDDSALARLDIATGAITTIDLGLDTSTLATGFGAVWVALNDWSVENGPGVTVRRLDPTTGRPGASIPVPAHGGPPDIVPGDRYLYVTSVLGADKRLLLAVDPRTNTVVAQRRVLGGGLAYGEGQLWITDSLRNRAYRLDPSSLRTMRGVRVGRTPGQAVIAADSLWVLNHLDGTLTVVPLDR